MALLTWLTYRIEKRELSRCAETYAKGDLVDIGCGIKPYKGLFAPFVSRHIGVDHEETSHPTSNIDKFGSAYEIPYPDGEFNTALCTAVLEHLEEPGIAVRECYRILKCGGIAIYTAPFIWHLHEEPRDFYRFTKHGLKHIFEKSGFEVLEIKPYCGFWGTFGQLFVYQLYRINVGPLRWFRVIATIGFLVQLVSLMLDRIDKTEQWTSLYILVARKNCEQ